jgi:squalene-associated FAD-dependent desaturase
MATVHVIGAGLAGLACALRAALAGATVVIYEAAGHAGGRCRSFRDDSLGCLIDNGSHMALGANEATRTYLADIGSADGITEIAPAAFPFHDLASGASWRVKPNSGPLPLWILSSDRRVPGTGPKDYLQALRLARAHAVDTVADCLGDDGPLFERMWQPLCRAVLNTDANEASAGLLWAMLRATFAKGEAACRPLFFHGGLSPTLIDPALATLDRLGAEIRMKARLRGLGWSEGRATSLHFAEGRLRVGADDAVVLAVPPEVCAELWPNVAVPLEHRPIVNAHFLLDEPAELPWGSPFLGIVGGTSQWLFARGNVLSVTISAAASVVDRPAWELANLLWSEAARVLGRNVGRVPPWRVIKERRATIAQTPAGIARRAGAATGLANLFIAGDWTDTGLPATIESAVRSGFDAAQLVLEPQGEIAS